MKYDEIIDLKHKGGVEMKYDEIIGRKYEGVKKHPRMSREARAAQFAPFAALTGYDKILRRTIRSTELEGRRVIVNTGESDWLEPS